MSDQLYCPECADKWSGAYNTDHRCVTCGSPLKAEEVNGELERVRAERDALAAHVDRLREALSQSLTAWGYEASQGDGIMEEHGSVYEECNKRCDEPAATSLARLKAQWQSEALVKAVAACAKIAKGQEKLAWMHQETLPDGEEVVGEDGIPYSNKALGATHCADEIGRMAIELRHQSPEDL